jgi:hypothetical protein
MKILESGLVKAPSPVVFTRKLRKVELQLDFTDEILATFAYLNGKGANPEQSHS